MTIPRRRSTPAGPFMGRSYCPSARRNGCPGFSRDASIEGWSRTPSPLSASPPVRGVEPARDAVVVHLAGELDLYNAEELRTALAQEMKSGPRRVILDLAGVDFLDSTVLGVLVEARSKLGRDGLALAAPRIETRRALQVSGLDRHLPVHDSVDAALVGS